MNFIELRVEDFIDEVLDTDGDSNAPLIQVLRKFAAFINRETEVYSVGELTEDVALDFLRMLRATQERKTATEALNRFYDFLHGKGLLKAAVRLSAESVLRPVKPPQTPVPGNLFDPDDASNSPRHRFRRDMD